MSLQPGTRPGNYEVLSELGRGGMGEVYKARDLKLGREVAIIGLAPGDGVGLPAVPSIRSWKRYQLILFVSKTSPKLGRIPEDSRGLESTQNDGEGLDVELFSDESRAIS